MARPFHLSWFLQGSSIQSWNQPWTGNIVDDWMYPRFFIELLQQLERAKFDYILLEDASYIGQAYNNSREFYLKHGYSCPRQEPSIVATLMAAATSKIGIVPTLATFTHHPYLVARVIGTLDQVSGGRIGWNVVTGSSDFAQMNFGREGHPPHDVRYEMAEEFIDCVTQLWDSWQPGAIVNDTETPMLIDHTKVRQIDFEGKYYKSRGPLNSGPCPQGRPVIAQAGGSAAGKAFAAKHADTIVASVRGVPAMKAYREDVTARLKANGRDPDSCKLFFLVCPIIGGTEEEALREKARQTEESNDMITARLAGLSKITNIDFSKQPLDKLVDQTLTTNGHVQMLEEFLAFSKGKTLRAAILDYNAGGEALDLVGTPEQVATLMADAMATSGGDGFLFTPPNTNRRTVAEITDGLVPVLQKRGLVRRAYNHDHLRDTLLEF
ncbi:NtaA/DmoA family FMN-dependent monooxygenase [Zavarzinia sp. CC-PAN008]|uniref:NtaA/DmoA family FMN-dependent monooxygenase n=1 Tax=Zavarzinia sp. CC-PAN008 TaxID=3243332 RepID=UPI003F742B4D